MNEATGVKVGTWDTLRLHPMALMRMVIEDKATVIGRDKRGRKIYEIKVDDTPEKEDG